MPRRIVTCLVAGAGLWFGSCKDNEEVGAENLQGLWVEANGAGDSLKIESDRWLEIKPYTATRWELYEYDIRENVLYLQWLLSSSSHQTPHPYQYDPKGKILVVEGAFVTVGTGRKSISYRRAN